MFAQKKAYRPSYKSKFSENEKWDYNIPPTITFEKKQSQYPEEQLPKHRKNKRFDHESNLSAEPLNHRLPPEKRESNYPVKRWGHDKYEESASPHLFFSNHPSKKGGQKKVERQFYCVREKYSQKDEPKETIEYHKKSHQKEEHLVRPNSAKETAVSSREDEGHSPEENSFISSLTSLLSQKDKETIKENEMKGSCNEFKDNAVIARGPIIDLLHSAHAADPHVLFEIMLQNDKGTQNILVWNNEKSYENFLNDVCEKNNIEGRMGLYFKINMLKRIKDLQPGNKEVGTLLNQLLDYNFGVILSDIKTCGGNMGAYARASSLINGACM